MEREPQGGSDVGQDLARDVGEEPGALRDAPPDLLSPIDESSPVSGHVVAPASTGSIADTPEHDWSAAARIIFRKQIVDFVIQHVALLLARAHELLHPSEFFAACHAYLNPITRESDCMNSRHAVATSVQHRPTASFALVGYPSRLTSSSRRCNSAVQ